MKIMSKLSDYLILLILLFGMGLAMAGIGKFGRLPDGDFPSYAPEELLHIQAPVHPDEYFFATVPVDMWKRNSLNPNFFEYPSGLIYLNYVFFGFRTTDLNYEVRTGSLRTFSPFSYYFIGRLWSVFGQVIAIASAYAIMRRIGTPYAAITAALLVASSYLLVQHAHYAKPGLPAVGIMMLCLWASVQALYTPSNRTRVLMLALSGIFAGLAGAVRYNAIAISITYFFISLVLLYRHKSWRFAILVFVTWWLMPLVFVVGTPAILFDFAEVLRQFRHISSQFLFTATNILEMTITTPVQGFYLLMRYLFTYGTGITASIFILFGLYGSFRERPKDLLKVNSQFLFSLLLLTYLLAYIVVTTRTIRPFLSDNLLILITPQFLLLAAIGADWVYRKVFLQRYLFALILIFLLLVPTLYNTLPMVNLFTRVDTRNQMQSWIYQHIHQGASFILLEPYNVPLDEAMYPSDQLFDILQWDNQIAGYDYLIVSRSRLDVWENFDEIISDREIAVYNDAFSSIDEQFTRVMSFDRPHVSASNTGMNTMQYWHHPQLILYCLNASACDTVQNNSE